MVAIVKDYYPEHEKLKAIKDTSQAIGEFLDLGPWTLCRWIPENSETHGSYEPVHDIQGVLAEWFGIDRQALDREKQEMLESLRGS